MVHHSRTKHITGNIPIRSLSLTRKGIQKGNKTVGDANRVHVPRGRLQMSNFIDPKDRNKPIITANGAAIYPRDISLVSSRNRNESHLLLAIDGRKSGR